MRPRLDRDCSLSLRRGRPQWHPDLAQARRGAGSSGFAIDQDPSCGTLRSSVSTGPVEPRPIHCGTQASVPVAGINFEFLGLEAAAGSESQLRRHWHGHGHWQWHGGTHWHWCLVSASRRVGSHASGPTSLFFGKHIYRLRTPLTANDPVSPLTPSRPNPMAPPPFDEL
jgi:hypothetical protein